MLPYSHRSEKVKVLVASGDADLAYQMKDSLRESGYATVCAVDGRQVLQALEIEEPELVVMDAALPRRSGLEVLGEIRRRSRVPVIILSGKKDEESIVRAIELDADDFVVKPFKQRELLARIKRVIRSRQASERSSAQSDGRMVCGNVSIFPTEHKVTVSERNVPLTLREFSLLHYLMLNRGQVLAVSDIIANVWGYDVDEDAGIVKAMILRLRRKIEPDPSRPRYVVNVYGAGYVLRDGSAE